MNDEDSEHVDKFAANTDQVARIAMDFYHHVLLQDRKLASDGHDYALRFGMIVNGLTSAMAWYLASVSVHYTNEKGEIVQRIQQWNDKILNQIVVPFVYQYFPDSSLYSVLPDSINKIPK